MNEGVPSFKPVFDLLVIQTNGDEVWKERYLIVQSYNAKAIL